MKAAIMKDVVELEKVQSMIEDIEEFFYRRGDLEGLGGTKNPDAWSEFMYAKKEVAKIINEHMKDMEEKDVIE
jgi:hypothetical protein